MSVGLSTCNDDENENHESNSSSQGMGIIDFALELEKIIDSISYSHYILERKVYTVIESMPQTLMVPLDQVTNQMALELIGNQTSIYDDCQEIIEMNDEMMLFLEERIENQDSSEEEKQELTEIKYKVLNFNQDIVLVRKLSQELRQHMSNVFLNNNDNQENELHNQVLEMDNKFNEFIHLNNETLGRESLLDWVNQAIQYYLKAMS